MCCPGDDSQVISFSCTTSHPGIFYPHFTDKETEALGKKKRPLWSSSEVGGLASLRQAGARDPLLQRLHLDKHLLQQQNTKKLQGSKNNCVHVQKDQKTKRPKTQLPLLKSRQQKQGPEHAPLPPCTQPHRRGGQTT